MTKHNHKFCEPHNTRKLVAALGGNSAGAARFMGVSGGTISKALKCNEIKEVNDLAAKGVLSSMPSEENDADSVREAVRLIATYMSSTPALSMPEDIFDMLGRTVKELSQEHRP